MSGYFENFPTILHKENNTGVGTVVTDIMRRVAIKKVMYDSVIDYYTQSIPTKERPEVLADTVYNDTLKHWILMMTNGVTDPFYDWVLSDDNFTQMMEKKYPNKYAIVKYYPNFFRVGEDLIDFNSGLTDEQFEAGESQPLKGKVVSFTPFPDYTNYEQRDEPVSNNTLRKGQLIYSTNAGYEDWVFKSNDTSGVLSNTMGTLVEEVTNPIISSTGLEINAVHHIESKEWGTADIENLKVVTNMEYEMALNEDNLFIDVIEERYISDIETQLVDLVK